MKENNTPLELCNCTTIHDELVIETKEKMLSDDTLTDLADLFKVLGDPTRVKILYALLVHEMCVCDLANVLNMTQSAISHQLRLLRNARLVRGKKIGKVVYYSLDDHHVRLLFNQGLEHVEE